MRTIVIKQNETWSDLICPHCKKILDTFHSECLYDEKECPYCKEKIERSIYQEEYDKECEDKEIITDNQKEIIEHYGIRNQAKHFMSECTELFEAILEHDLYTDYMGSGTDTEHDKKNHVEEEIADVLNFIEQFIVHFELDTERIKNIQVNKQERTIYEFKNNIKKEDRV